MAYTRAMTYSMDKHLELVDWLEDHGWDPIGSSDHFSMISTYFKFYDPQGTPEEILAAWLDYQKRKKAEGGLKLTGEEIAGFKRNFPNTAAKADAARLAELHAQVAEDS